MTIEEGSERCNTAGSERGENGLRTKKFSWPVQAGGGKRKQNLP